MISLLIGLGLFMPKKEWGRDTFGITAQFVCTHHKVPRLGWARECPLILTVLVGQREPVPQGAGDPERNRGCCCVVESWSEKGILELGEYVPFSLWEQSG